ncbi:transcriptional regulator NrdR [Verrucomicrobia bacterium]|jgi:transcriptional repressor NrdR|nr:transcriptional regulator NrdR [Verrucomicrobiota bacterium]MDB4665333.1 transcriptional regulator NrdR [Verrucomicrobiota bacterium]MDG1889704.1 transcriptional regulator NrdR [Verrucomicrobiota bacterium]
MKCSKCSCLDDKVVDSRSSKEGAVIRRRRECLECGFRFTTYEEVERDTLMVIKRDGRRELFSKDKLAAGLHRACEKRPVSQQIVHELIDRIYNSVLDEYEREVPSMVIGERIMNGLRVVDEVAYVRFASVYRRFAEATEFVQEVQKLETTI